VGHKTSRSSSQERQSRGAFPLRTLLLWLGLVLAAGIVLVLLTTDYLSDLARQRALTTILGEAEIELTERAETDLSGADLPVPLRFAVAPVISPEASLLLYDDLARYLGERVGQPAELLIQADYARTNELLKDGGCDVALICTYAFIRSRAEAGIRAIVVPVVRGEVTYNSYIVVAADSPYRVPADLAGSRFASADEMSTTGWLFPAVSLLDQGEDPKSFFSSHLLTGSHDRSLAAVIEGDADGTAVHSLVFERAPKQLRDRVRIIARSPPYGMPPVVVPPTVPESLREKMREALINAHLDPAGKVILRTLEIDRFVVPGPGHYESVEALVRRWEER
jgi:phosphonate transport system substrate-binding protein